MVECPVLRHPIQAQRQMTVMSQIRPSTDAAQHWISMPSLSAPAFPDGIRFTSCANSVSRRGSGRTAPTSLDLRLLRFQRNGSRNGAGLNTSRRRPIPNAVSTTWRTGLTRAGTSSASDASPPHIIRRRCAVVTLRWRMAGATAPAGFPHIRNGSNQQFAENTSNSRAAMPRSILSLRAASWRRSNRGPRDGLPAVRRGPVDHRHEPILSRISIAPSESRFAVVRTP